MGIDVYNYFGAFAKISSKNIETINLFNGCSNLSCKAYGQSKIGKYCAECGQQLDEMKNSTFHQYNYNQWIEENDFVDYLAVINDYNSKTKIMDYYAFPNNPNGNEMDKVKLFSFYDNDGGILEVYEEVINPQQYKNEFKQMYSEIFNALEADGFKVEILFGMFSGSSC